MFKGYDVNEQIKLVEAEKLCAKVDFEVQEILGDCTEGFKDVYHDVMNQEMDKGTPTDEILETLGKMVKDTANLNLKSSEDGVCKNITFDFTVDDYGLSFTMDYRGAKEEIDENSLPVKCILENLLDEEYKYTRENNVEEAIDLCERIDYDLNGNLDSLAIYRETAEQEISKGTPENEVLEILGTKVKETATLYLEAEKSCTEERYEDDVYKNTEFDFSVADEGLSFSLKCDGTEYNVTNGYDLKEIVDNAIETARDEYEAEYGD